MNDELMLKSICNGGTLPIQDIPEANLEEFLRGIIELTGLNWRIASYFGVPDGDGIALWCILGGTNEQLGILRSRVKDRLPSITSACPEAHLFEREIGEQCGMPLDGHPWFKPVRYVRSLCPESDAWNRKDTGLILPGVDAYYRVDGSEIHEVAVGPVHAGIIEPGHFRFQCHGETVYHLEIALGYQHRGVERALTGGPHAVSMAQMETIAGDTTIGHATAYAILRESLSGTEVPLRAQALRAVALELERLANHCGDLGALAGDIGFLPTMSFCGRIRGDLLNASALLCGSRFGRGLVRPGGVYFDCSQEQVGSLSDRLEVIRRDYRGAVELLWESPSVMARFEKSGQVTHDEAYKLGMVGPAARACGIARDVRHDYPHGIYRTNAPLMAVEQGGDVLARAMLRWNESLASLDFLKEQLQLLPGGNTLTPCGPVQKDRIAVSLVEGWRGEICHTVITDSCGKFLRYKITDPSFHNWNGLAIALRNEQISDFPLCNKSFNLSYCGYDL